MTSIWQPLFFNLAVVSIILVAWDYVAGWVERRGLSARWRSSLMGLLLAAGAIASMIMATPLRSGFIFDLRSPLIAAAAYFGGIPAAIVTVVLPTLYRLYIGGAGAIGGVTGIVIAGGIGLLFWDYAQTHRKTSLQIVSFGVATALGGLLSFLVFPADVRWALLTETGPALVGLVFISATIIGILLNRELKAKELEHVNRLYRAMVDELPDCLNVKDLDGKFLVANPATATLMQSGSTQALIGKTDFDFYPQELAEEFRKAETDMLQSQTAHRIEQPALFADGTKGWHDTLKAPLKDGKGRVIGVITYNRNITEQKRVSQFKNEFISTVSHELRTPLTSIRGSLGLIVGGTTGAVPEKAANLIKIAHSNSERLVRLINDILDIEKIESGKMVFQIKPMQLRPVVEQAIAASANYRPEQRVQIALLDDAPRARANIDPDRLHQALINLVSNAIKFSPPDEVVSVKLERLSGNGLRMSVADRGSGIPASFRNRIFGKFEQADASSTRQQGGTGLGLSIAQAIVERLNGKIGFHDRKGGGTVFYIDLPEAEAPLVESPGHDQRARILIVEDEPDIAAVIAALLDAEGFASDVAPDISSAKKLLGSRAYSALTLDIKLAGESGIDFFREIRGSPATARLAVIVISAVLDDARQALNGAAIGVIDWLEKPVDPKRLHAALDKITLRKSRTPSRILHVEDDKSVIDVIAESIGPGVTITPAATMRDAARLLTQQSFDLIILDVALPDGSGLDLLPDLPTGISVVLFSGVEVDLGLNDRIKAILTKTKASELDVARAVKGLLAQSDAPRSMARP
jgi:PAS domain S-box-containing protein